MDGAATLDGLVEWNCSFLDSKLETVKANKTFQSMFYNIQLLKITNCYLKIANSEWRKTCLCADKDKRSELAGNESK